MWPAASGIWVVFAALGCGPAPEPKDRPPIPQDFNSTDITRAPYVDTPPAPYVAVPRELIPNSLGTGSGIPVDPNEPALAESPPPSVARGTGSPADKRLAEGDAAYARGDYEAAEKAYKTAGDLDKKDPAPIVGAVRARLAKEDVPTDFGGAPESRALDAAIKELKRAIKLDPRYAPAHTELGRALLVQGKAPEAEGALQRGAELAPNDPEARSAFGVALLAIGKIDDAVRELTRSAELAPGDPERQANLGTALIAAGKTEAAIAAYERSVKLAPNNARTLNDLGTAYLAAGNLVSAVVHLEAAVARDPKRATYRSNLGFAWHLRKDLAKAMALYREALALDDKLGSAWINLGNALAQTGKLAEAREAYKKAQAINPSDPRVKAVMEELDALEGKGPAKAPPK